MSDWTERRQWARQLRDGDGVVDIVITRDVSDESRTWWAEGFDRVTLLSPPGVYGFALGLAEAKRDALAAGKAMLLRMARDRGGV